LSGSDLQGIDDPNNLSEVPSGAGWVEETELELLIRANDEYGSNRHRHSLRVHWSTRCWDHAEGLGKSTGWISDDRIADIGAGVAVDVRNPLTVAGYVVAGYSENFYVAFLEFWHELR